MRTYFIVLAVLVVAGSILQAQQSAQQDSSPPLSVSDIEHGLKAGVTNTRMAALVKRYGVDFELTDAVEKELKTAGANSDLLLAISLGKRAGGTSEKTPLAEPIPLNAAAMTQTLAPSQRTLQPNPPASDHEHAQAHPASTAQKSDGSNRQSLVEGIPDSVLSVIRHNYAQPEIQLASEGNLREQLEAVDVNSAYMTPKEYRSFQLHSTDYQGNIGVVIWKRSGYAVVVSVTPGSPSDKAGMQSLDIQTLKFTEERYKRSSAGLNPGIKGL